MISYNAEGVPLPALHRRALTAWIRRVAAGYARRVGDIGYLFVGDERILAVNKAYLQHDYYTDIITFDASEGQTINGDIFISLDTVRSNAALYQRPYAEELHRVIIHGILHLCGLHDKTAAERATMRAAEDRALRDYALLPAATPTP